MKQTRFITTLVVAAVLCGICLPAQAVEVTMGFDTPDLSATPPNWVDITTVTPYSEVGYTLDVTTSGGGFLDRVWNASINSFTGNVVGSWGAMVSHVTRTDGVTNTFKAVSIAVGNLLGVSGNTFALGQTDTGTEVTQTFISVGGAKTVLSFNANFDNLTNLVFSNAGGANPAFDELVLDDATGAEIVIDPPAAVVTLDFDGLAPAGGFYGIGFVETEDDYNITWSGLSSGGILDSAYDTEGANPADVSLFTGGALSIFSADDTGTYTFTRADDGPFSAVSLAVGCFGLAARTNSPFKIVGNYVGGGSVTNGYDPAPGTKTTVYLNYQFTNLASLAYISFDSTVGGAAAPLIDEVVLTTNELTFTVGTVIAVK